MSATRDGAEPAPGWARILLLGALSAFGLLSMDVYLPALPQIGEALRASPGASQLSLSLSLSLSLCLVGLGAGQLVGGPLSDRWGRRPLLLGGIGLFVVAVVLSALAPSIEVLLGARLLTGLAGAVGLVVARAMIRDLYGAAVPPIASLAGVRPTVMAATMLVCVLLAAVPAVLLLRWGPPAAVPPPTAPPAAAPPPAVTEPRTDL